MTGPDQPARVIVTKRKVYALAHDQQGQPLEGAFPAASLPAFLKGAKLYEVDGRKVIARPDTAAD